METNDMKLPQWIGQAAIEAWAWGFSVWLDLHSEQNSALWRVFDDAMQVHALPRSWKTMPSNLDVGQHRWEQQLVLTWTPKMDQSWFSWEATHFGIGFFPSANFLFFIWCRTGHSSRLWHYQDWLCVGNLRWWMLTRLLPEWFLVWTLITTYIACSPHCRWSELSEMEAKESSNKKDDTSESPHHFVLRKKQNPKS